MLSCISCICVFKMQLYSSMFFKIRLTFLVFACLSVIYFQSLIGWYICTWGNIMSWCFFYYTFRTNPVDRSKSGGLETEMCESADTSNAYQRRCHRAPIRFLPRKAFFTLLSPGLASICSVSPGVIGKRRFKSLTFVALPA